MRLECPNCHFSIYLVPVSGESVGVRCTYWSSCRWKVLGKDAATCNLKSYCQYQRVVK